MKFAAAGTRLRSLQASAEPTVVTPPRDHARMSNLTDGSITIDCDECVVRDSGACESCVVSFILGREPQDAVVIDVAEHRALRLLSRSGLVPKLCHRRAVS